MLLLCYICVPQRWIFLILNRVHVLALFITGQLVLSSTTAYAESDYVWERYVLDMGKIDEKGNQMWTFRIGLAF